MLQFSGYQLTKAVAESSLPGRSEREKTKSLLSEMRRRTGKLYTLQSIKRWMDGTKPNFDSILLICDILDISCYDLAEDVD